MTDFRLLLTDCNSRRAYSARDTAVRLYPELGRIKSGGCSRCSEKRLGRVILEHIAMDKDVRSKDRAVLRAIMPGWFVDNLDGG